MTPEAAVSFEAKRAADPELEALVQQHRLERQGLELLVERDLLAKMQAWDRETTLLQSIQPAPRGVVRPMRVFLRSAAAAAVIVAAALGWWWYSDSRTGDPDTGSTIVQTAPGTKSKTPTIRKPKSAKPSGPKTAPYRDQEPDDNMAGNNQRPSKQEPAPIEELPTTETLDYAAVASEFYKDRDFFPPKGSKGVSESAPYNQALDNYQNGKYGNAIDQLQSVLSPGGSSLQNKELIAHSYYKSGQYNEAISVFNELIASRKQPYAQRAEWGLALDLVHLLPAKKPLLDRVLANILANPQHPFYSEAKALQGRLQ